MGKGKRRLYHQLHFHSFPEKFPIVPSWYCVFRQLPQTRTDYLYKTHPDTTHHRGSLLSLCRLTSVYFGGWQMRIFPSFRPLKNVLRLILTFFNKHSFITFTGMLTSSFLYRFTGIFFFFFFRRKKVRRCRPSSWNWTTINTEFWHFWGNNLSYCYCDMLNSRWKIFIWFDTLITQTRPFANFMLHGFSLVVHKIKWLRRLYHLTVQWFSLKMSTQPTELNYQFS